MIEEDNIETIKKEKEVKNIIREIYENIQDEKKL